MVVTSGGAGRCLTVGGGDAWRKPGFRQTDRHPVTCGSWDDAQEYRFLAHSHDLGSRTVTRILVLLVLLLSAVPAAAQDRIALAGPMRFSTEDVALVGWFTGAQADLWRVEPFAYLSEDVGVWALQAGAAVPVWRGALGRLSLRFGADVVLGGPAVEPGAHPLVGVGGRLGRRYGVAASVDRAPEYTLMRVGIFVRW